MKRKILIRYIILMTFLIACAAAAWSQARETGKHHEDAVLAHLNYETGGAIPWTMQYCI